MKKKVVHLLGGLRTGGAETLIKEYALKMDKSKWEVVIICYDHIVESPYEKILAENGIRLIFIEDLAHIKCNLRVLKRIVSSLNTYYYVRKLLKAEKPDVLHVHLEFLRYVMFAKPYFNIKLFYTVHSLPSFFWFQKDKMGYNRLISKLEYEAAKWLVKKRSLRFIALHDDMRREINQIFHVDNTVVLNNGIDFSRFNELKPKNDVRMMLGIDSKAYVIGHVGRFSCQKNHMFLIELFKRIFAQRKDAYLLMIGDGPEKQKIEDELTRAGLDDNYTILSNRSDVPDLLNSMDIFVFPSVVEGLGIALVEAQKAGVMCVASTDVPESAVISNLAKRISLNLGADEWASYILSLNKPSEVIYNDEDWDMRKVVERLAKIYLGEI